MHITPKAVLSIIACLVIIISGYNYYGDVRKSEVKEEVDTTKRHDLVEESWVWQSTVSGDEVVNAPSEAFVLSFSAGSQMMSSTDCNSLSGYFTLDGKNISFSPFMSTKMFCEKSEENVYADALSKTEAYVVEGNILKLTLSNGKGVMYFKKK